ncbi:MAG: 23S rRNA (uracil(1939)-C(5))-methyltransferase RlmD [Betaproteobacteria bacterium]|nr:23S rRNA (uracil(1939)-C(5))-methyltransferase RlmD [Betaproteobacteria bacterium]
MGRRTIGAVKVLRTIQRLPIESVDLEGQGVAHHEGRVVFVAGALAGEVVDVEVLRERPRYLKARAARWHRESADRVQPRCDYFGVCGGCSMQHASAAAQIAIKQRSLEDALWHIGRLRPQEMLSPLRGPSWGYRARARLSVRWVDKKGGLLVGFHERGSSFVAKMDSCEVLHPRAAAMLPRLKELIASLTIAREVAQAELAVGDASLVWVLRNLSPLGPGDHERLSRFEREEDVQIWLQPGGPSTAEPLNSTPEGKSLWYALPDFGLTMPFSPVDFTQVNFAVNRSLVSLAIRLLDVRPEHRVADFFCGLGNFTLALASRARQVVGVEGSQALTDQAMRNAQSQGLSHALQFSCVNLFEVGLDWLLEQGAFDRALIDPPREGAQALCEALAALSRLGRGPHRLVMVSCNPATLARDAAILAHQGAWVLRQAGVVNMFAQTAHVESIAVFERTQPT